jgi:PAS domain S-box-containing protein
LDGVIQWVSPAVGALLGWRPEDLTGTVALDLAHPDDLPVLARNHSQLYAGLDVDDVAGRLRTRHGNYRTVTVRARALRDLDGRVAGSIVTFRDTHEQTAALRALTTLSRGNGVLVRSRDEQELLDEMCWTVVDAGSYLFAWYGRPQRDDSRSVAPVAVAGQHDGYLDEIAISWGDGPLGQGPSGTAIRTRTTQVRSGFGDDPSYAPWLRASLRHGFRSSISLPVVVEGEVDGALMVYAADNEAFDPLAQSLLEDLARDIGYGLTRLRDASRLAEALSSSVFLLAAAVESRDPYTAGHQSQVGRLSEEIGRELGLDDQRLRGLALGAAIHDLGKISIDHEVLAKRGALSAAEWSELKAHPITGFTIASRFPWPWPIAQMIHQHHERLDGSGYPRALRGDEILLEARIIAVADTYEAMAHDRPYRKAPGEARAREVITGGRGTLYDHDVVDAFERVLAAGFRFDDLPDNVDPD